MKRVIFLLVVVLATTSFAQLQIKNSIGSVLVHITQSGNVGIGTTTPQRIMHTVGVVRLAGLGTGTTADNSVAVVQADDDLVTRALPASVWDGDNQALSVAAGAANTSIVNLENSATNVTLQAGNNITLSEAGNTITIAAASAGAEVDPQVDETTLLVNRLSKWNGTALTTSSIFDNGDIGIGTTAPAAKLHTIGTVRHAGLGTGTTADNIVAVIQSDNDMVTRTLPADVWDGDDQALSVGAGTTNTSIVNLENSATSVTLQAGNNITLSEAGNTITIAAAGAGAEVDPQVDETTLLVNRLSKWNGTALTTGSIFDNGDIGIGTTAPAAKLHTIGTVRHAGLGTGTTADNIVAVIQSDNDMVTRTLPADVWDGDDQALSVGAGTTNTSIVNLENSATSVTLQAGNYISLSESGNSITISSNPPAAVNYWNITGSDLYPISTGYYVGIGTTNPTAQLHTTGSVRLQQLGGGATSRLVQAGTDGTLSALGIGTTYQFLRGDGVWRTPDYRWFDEAGGTGICNSNLGNVGIGAPAPAYKLTVNGTVAINSSGGSYYSILHTQTQTGNYDYWLPPSLPASGEMKFLRCLGNTGSLVWAAEEDPEVGANSHYYVPRWNATLATPALEKGGIYDNNTGTGIAIGSTRPNAALRIANSKLGYNTWGPASGIKRSLLAYDTTFAQNNEDHYTALAGYSRSMTFDDDEGWRIGVHGVLVNPDGHWVAAGALGWQWDALNHICAVQGVLNEPGLGGSLPSGVDSTYAGGFYNPFSQNRTDGHFVIRAMGKKSIFTGVVGVGTGKLTSEDYFCLEVGSHAYVAGSISIGTTLPAYSGTRYSPLRLVPSSVPNDNDYPLYLDSDGLLCKQTSSKRYKTDITDLDDDFSKILKIQPKSFRYKSGLEQHIGYIAEELDAAGLDDLVVYDKQNRPDAVRYDQIPIYLLEIIKKQQQAIEALTEKVEALQKK